MDCQDMNTETYGDTNNNSNVFENKTFQVLASTPELNVFNESDIPNYFNSTERVMAVFDMPDNSQRDKIHCVFAPVRSIFVCPNAFM